MTDEERFLFYINDNYNELKTRMRKYCSANHYRWDDDVYSDTILKCHDTIQKQGGLKDGSDEGILNYFFQSFQRNLKREKQYSRNAKRDDATEDIPTKYEKWYNENNDAPSEKIRSDLWKDFATLYIVASVSENFDNEKTHLFTTKMLCNLTYKQLAERTGKKGVRSKVLECKNWVKENIKKEDIQKAFNDEYVDLME